MSNENNTYLGNMYSYALCLKQIYDEMLTERNQQYDNKNLTLFATSLHNSPSLTQPTNSL